MIFPPGCTRRPHQHAVLRPETAARARRLLVAAKRDTSNWTQHDIQYVSFQHIECSYANMLRHARGSVELHQQWGSAGVFCGGGAEVRHSCTCQSRPLLCSLRSKRGRKGQAKIRRGLDSQHVSTSHSHYCERSLIRIRCSFS